MFDETGKIIPPKKAQNSEAYPSQAFEANGLAEFVDIFSYAPQDNFYARGESKENNPAWLPSIWRPGHPYNDRTPVVPNGSYTQGELDSIMQCQADLLSGVIEDYYFQSFHDDFGLEITVDSVDILHWTALAQHYGYPTRLIDVTTDAFAALYFAVTGDPGDDGFVNWVSIGGHSNDLSALPNTETAGCFLDILGIAAADGGDEYKPGDTTLNYIRPPLPNRRTEAQHGAFIWARAPDQSYTRNGFVIRVPANVKPSITRELSMLNYDSQHLFPTPI